MTSNASRFSLSAWARERRRTIQVVALGTLSWAVVFGAAGLRARRRAVRVPGGPRRTDDPALYDLLALFDALRSGQSRERELARRHLSRRLQ